MPNSAKSRLVTDKHGADTKVYVVRNNVKQWVTNADTVLNLGYTWDDIQDIGTAELALIPTAEPLGSTIQKVYETSDYIYCIEKSWSDNYNIGVIGWAVGKKKMLKNLRITVDGTERKITDWQPRPDIFEHYQTNTDYAAQVACGFSVTINRAKEHLLSFAPNSEKTAEVLRYTSEPVKHAGIPLDKNLEQRFRDIVNNAKLSVLEVGSRVSPGGTNKRPHFKKASKYVGFDYHPGKLVDVVGDAHKLSTYFPTKFDALYSDSVIEHLAAPWKAVIEMNKVLKKGGYVYHSAPSCWVLHDMPWDFWRFSDAGFKSLFSRAFGFTVIDVEYTAPMSLHLDGPMGDSFANMPLSPAYGFVSILAQKTHNINPVRARFNYGLKHLVDKGTHYPEWNS